MQDQHMKTQIEEPASEVNYPTSSTYAVKYLGIVDGTMGILSRKMALQSVKQHQPQYLQSAEKVSPLYDRVVEISQRYGDVGRSSPMPRQKKFTSVHPVLGSKYARANRYQDDRQAFFIVPESGEDHQQPRGNSIIEIQKEFEDFEDKFLPKTELQSRETKETNKLRQSRLVGAGN